MTNGIVKSVEDMQQGIGPVLDPLFFSLDAAS
jgi:hypothetical protein